MCEQCSQNKLNCAGWRCRLEKKKLIPALKYHFHWRYQSCWDITITWTHRAVYPTPFSHCASSLTVHLNNAMLEQHFDKMAIATTAFQHSPIRRQKFDETVTPATLGISATSDVVYTQWNPLTLLLSAMLRLCFVTPSLYDLPSTQRCPTTTLQRRFNLVPSPRVEDPEVSAT